jgi:hypothetical protein
MLRGATNKKENQMSQQITIGLSIDVIEKEQGIRKLASLAWCNEGDMHAGFITPEQYAQNCALLSKKLGIPITKEALETLTKKLLANDAPS